MNTDKIWIRDIAEVCAAKGVQKAVISPGSRSAPLVIAFNRHPAIECIQVIDERVAAFFALGIAQQTGNPVALICTSGSAALNYAPAIAEAYYQRVPLIILTADRPDELIEQRDGQTIRQQNVYSNYIRKSFHLPVVGEHEDDRWFSARIISEALNVAVHPVPGPVHVNVPLREPLYNVKEDAEYVQPKVIEQLQPVSTLSEADKTSLQNEWTKYKSKLLIVGGMFDTGKTSSNLTEAFAKLMRDPSVVALTESSSNLPVEGVIPIIDPVLEAMPKNEKASFTPELLVTIGGEIVSKKIKAFFRANKPKAHWHIDISGDHVDTYKCLTKVIALRMPDFLDVIKDAQHQQSDFRNKWLAVNEEAKKIREDVLKQSPYSDFTVFNELLRSLPDNCNLHLGNSTPIRYANLFEVNPTVTVNCNRGTSGIDGCSSTAAGAAFSNQILTTLITGDISFLYDSNALWNKHLPKNLRIIILNNSGGNIFRIIPGPSSLNELEEYFETKQEQTVEHIAKAFSLPYYFCDDMQSLKTQLKDFYKPQEKAAILEIKTPNETSAKVLQEYMNMK
ncbi:MAG: 2-succinyl-5-enolpyruvyl-6-hydroxy-3-cyclohexene-1-carboxylic-acid synthase [Chitinophagales bacterium]|nr:2-succinyl-5-enolpyruvyl-6-hydroxy-3-cyclohexene-1-carboxylic-acid synthase [Chitinophagales bacterium]